MKRVLIIGGGPAGLAASASLSKAKDIAVYVVDAGKLIRERNHDKASDLGCGIGGAGLFSDGKFSYYPSGTGLYNYLDNNKLKNSYNWVRELLDVAKIESYCFPDTLDSNSITDFKLKSYPSTYGDLSKRYNLIESMIKQPNTYYLTNSKVTSITKKGEHYICDMGDVSSSNKRKIEVDGIVLATGRFGNLYKNKIFKNVLFDNTKLRYEVGVRIESESNKGFLSKLNNPDVKAIWETPFGELRTFCTCRNGEVWNIEYDGISAISGRSDGPETKYSNFGLLARFKGDSFEAGKKLFEECMNTEVIKNNQVVWQTLDSFLNETSNTSGNIDIQQRPWFPRESFINGSLSTHVGFSFVEIFRSSLKRLVDWSPSLLSPSTVIMFPVIEGVGNYISFDRNLKVPGENIWCAGDISGRFRGIIPALCSGYYAGSDIAERL